LETSLTNIHAIILWERRGGKVCCW